MTTSGVSNTLMTVEEIIQAAYEELGSLSAGEKATGEEVALAMRSLTWMLKSFAARGINLWRQTDRQITVPANAQSVTLDNDVEDVLDARMVQSSTYERLLFQYSREQYFQLPNKASPGFPTAFYVDKQLDQVILRVWPVPTADTVIKIDIVRRIQDVTDPTQTIDVPQKWTETVYIALAARLASVMGVMRIDPATASALAQRAAALEQVLLEDDRPPSVYMGAWDERYF